METTNRTFEIPKERTKGYFNEFVKLISNLQMDGYEIVPADKKYDTRIVIRDPTKVIPTQDYGLWKDFPQEDVSANDRRGLVGKILGKEGKVQIFD